MPPFLEAEKNEAKERWQHCHLHVAQLQSGCNNCLSIIPAVGIFSFVLTTRIGENVTATWVVAFSGARRLHNMSPINYNLSVPKASCHAYD